MFLQPRYYLNSTSVLMRILPHLKQAFPPILTSCTAASRACRSSPGSWTSCCPSWGWRSWRSSGSSTACNIGGVRKVTQPLAFFLGQIKLDLTSLGLRRYRYCCHLLLPQVGIVSLKCWYSLQKENIHTGDTGNCCHFLREDLGMKLSSWNVYIFYKVKVSTSEEVPNNNYS